MAKLPHVQARNPKSLTSIFLLIHLKTALDLVFRRRRRNWGCFGEVRALSSAQFCIKIRQLTLMIIMSLLATYKILWETQILLFNPWEPSLPSEGVVVLSMGSVKGRMEDLLWSWTWVLSHNKYKANKIRITMLAILFHNSYVFSWRELNRIL
jgi:hypothetical protein